MENIQDEVMKIHHKYGITEMANYQIQLLFDKNYLQLQTRIKELEEEKTTELITEMDGVCGAILYEIIKTKCCGIGPITRENFCRIAGEK